MTHGRPFRCLFDGDRSRAAPSAYGYSFSPTVIFHSFSSRSFVTLCRV